MHKCILIVDDNAPTRHMLRTIFEDAMGWEVCGEAENGREAVEKARELNPDLIILDLSMPIMNGLTAAPVLRRMMPAVPIILFTLHENNAVEREALSVGVSAVVSKSASMKTLVHQAEDLLAAAWGWFPLGTQSSRPLQRLLLKYRHFTPWGQWALSPVYINWELHSFRKWQFDSRASKPAIGFRELHQVMW
jgi:DNA-binding NarL/FixJ family response regulator